MKNFGKNIDLVAGIYSQNLLQERNCVATYLYDSPICCAVPRNHPLADKVKLKIHDLYGEDILILQRYYLEHFDRIRADLLHNHSMIKTVDIPFFNINVFNQCVNENKIMLVTLEWKNIHPMLKMIPVEWDYSIPFGIMYSPQPNNKVKLFIDAVKQLYQ